MRIATTQYATTLNTALQNASFQLEDIQAKMASGNKLSLPSDDPVTSVRLARLTREDAALDQYRSNIGALKSRLSQSESSLDGMTGDMQQARDLMVAAADGASATLDENARGAQLASLRDSLFYGANVRDEEGRYVFSGTASATATVTYDATAPVGSRYTFTGNTESQHVVVGNGVTQVSNVSLPEMSTLLNQLDSAATALQMPGVSANDDDTRTAMSAALDGLDTGLAAVGGKIAGLGSTQNLLQTMDTNHANVSISNKQSLIDLGQLDYNDAAVKLNGYTLAVQATQKAYAKVAQLSLFNEL